MADPKSGEKQVNIEISIDLWNRFEKACTMFKKKQAVAASLLMFIEATPEEQFKLIQRYIDETKDKST